MNWSRGLFRLWFVITVLWISIGAISSWDRIMNPYIPQNVYVAVEPLQYDNMFEAFATEANEDQPDISKGGLYKINSYEAQTELRKTRASISFPNNVTLLMPSSVDVQSVPKIFFTNFAKINSADRLANARWDAVRDSAAIYLAPSALVFVLGWALLWAFSGFRKTNSMS